MAAVWIGRHWWLDGQAQSGEVRCMGLCELDGRGHA